MGLAKSEWMERSDQAYWAYHNGQITLEEYRQWCHRLNLQQMIEEETEREREYWELM